MNKNLLQRLSFAIVLILSFFLITSCSSVKNVKYFRDIPDSTLSTSIGRAEYVEPVIQTDDILTIVVQTLDPNATSLINMGNVPVSATGTSTVNTGILSVGQQVVSGYLVDKEGDVELPILGKVQVVGLTTSKAKTLIEAKAGEFYKSPSVTVRYANFKISVAGEVARPSTYIIPNEKVTILDALTMAGDLTIFGKRDNVLLIRQNEDGTKTAYRINLNKSNIMTAPYYYLRQNDFIYVEPGKAKAAANDANQLRTYTIIGSALSVLIIIASRL
ncbi:polysaccharide biosynthesis/export family protein [Mucilaginibacter sp. OK283]|uniref:polysaccharide biosynthesis/export family protein n=1 Tax=Mucilaginibacter sp. OK283 TaxID=1881049 RepID=UPI0008B62316|nr:polysaccharide biosynthesis/export family protein [Mucilaginibacter sp. OK283]SEO45813.1 polysaccharide export outer membrane protein [Mucilaginibacter sp. OK283]